MHMIKEYWIMVALFIISILLLAVFGRKKTRESLYAVLAAQAIGWPATILLVYSGKIDSPVRLFPIATDSNFILAFVFYPAVFTAYYLSYPRHKCRILRIAFTLVITGSAALIHVALQKYTDLIKYISFSGYIFWLIVIITFSIQRLYINWYFRQVVKEAPDNSE